MTAWFFLTGAIVTEVSGTLCLRMASRAGANRLWWLPVIVGYATAFALLGATLAAGMDLAVAYGIWSAVGVALTAVLGRVLFREPMSGVMALGVALIIGGVLLIELGAH